MRADYDADNDEDDKDANNDDIDAADIADRIEWEVKSGSVAVAESC